MQIPTIPPPLMTNIQPQDVATKVVPNVQAAPPLQANTVAPTPKSDKSQLQADKDKERKRREASAERSEQENTDESAEEGQRGASVNISV